MWFGREYFINFEMIAFAALSYHSLILCKYGIKWYVAIALSCYHIYRMFGH